MKAIIQSIALGTALLLVPIFSLLLTSCEVEDLTSIIEQPDEEPPIDTVGHPDEVEDLVAWFNPLEKTLLVRPGYREQSLALLGAQPTTDGMFTAAAVTATFQPVIISFHVLELPAELIASQAAAQATVEPVGPELIHEYTVNGTSFKQFKNAKCGVVEKGFSGNCYPSDGGGSNKNEWYDRSRCGRGDGFCTEVLAVMGRRVDYFNANCQGPIKSESSYMGYQCWQ